MLNYFELLGLTPQFDVVLSSLESAYFKAQQQCHPDRAIGKSSIEKQAALSRSVDVNKAYQILKDPLKRAQYLLSLQGIRVGTENDSVKPSQALLVEVIEMRESMSEKEILTKMIEQSIALIGEHYKTNDLKAMAQETLRLGYLMKAHK